MNILFWNINGRKHLIKSEKIQNWFKENFNIIFLSETHLTKQEKYKLASYTEHHNPYSDEKDRKARGGVSCFIKDCMVEYIEEVNKTTAGHISVRFKNGDMVFSTYIAPQDSPFYDPMDFCNVANSFVPIDNKRLVLGGGDLNGRFGDMPRTVCPTNGIYRDNCDPVVNDHGKEIISICKTFSCHVINNLNVPGKVFDGDFTFRKGPRKSQNDTILANKSAISALKKFTIHKMGWNPSDHAPVSVQCAMEFTKESIGLNASKDLLTERVNESIVRPKRINRQDVDWNNYKTFVENDLDTLDNFVENLLNQASLENLDKVVDNVSRCLYRSAKLASTNIETGESTAAHSDVCDDQVYEMATAMLDDFDKNKCSLEEYEAARKQAVEHLLLTSSKAERKAWHDVVKEKDSKALWDRIGWNGSVDGTNTNDFPDLEELRDQFQMKSETTDDSTLFKDVKENQHVPLMDNDITLEEIKKAHLTAKEDKSTADGWVKSMLTNVPLGMLLIFQIIYNSILKFHVYPTTWRTTIVNAIFKNKGVRTLAKYYRGISIVYLMSKIFDIIMLNRFVAWFKPSDRQTAYQEKIGCPDNLFLVRCLIAHAMKVKEKLFLISIDFDGAFDRVSRSVLIRKLSLFGAGTIFVTCIASMYLKTDNVIFQGKNHIKYSLYAGIKQGLPLSPILFLFYVNDIFDFFDALYGASRCIFEMVHVLMHADDATLIAATRDLAVSKLKNLLHYCRLNCIIPQYTKCEFIAINGDTADREPIPFGEKVLNSVSHLGLLGSHLTATGLLSDDLKLHMDARYKSCIKYFNFLRANQLAPLCVKIKVLKACVINSLLTNCETFGHCIPKDLEKTYNKLLRRTLNVRSNTPSLLLYIESGFLPIKALIIARQLKFFNRYKEQLTGNTCRVQMFHRLLGEPTNYLQHYIDISTKYPSVADVYRESKEEVKQQIRDLADKGTAHYKYKIYTKMNPNLEKSPFITNFHPLSRDAIRFRLGSHILPIETGRWSRKPREDRLCVECGVLGDERHAIFDCTNVDRRNIIMPEDICDVWKMEGVFDLMHGLKEAGFLD